MEFNECGQDERKHQRRTDDRHGSLPRPSEIIPRAFVRIHGDADLQVSQKHLGMKRTEKDFGVIRNCDDSSASAILSALDVDVEKLLCSAQFSAAVADREFCAAVAKHWPTVRARVSTVQLQQARKLADQLGGEAQVRYEQAVRRARQFGVEVP